MPGDDVYVTGPLGGSLESGRHLTFTPRLAEATFLADTLGPNLHAMMDISDGLGIDAGRIASASGVRIVLEQGLIPINADTTDPLRALSDGEDYELLLTAAAQSPPPGCTRIGTVEPGDGVVLNGPAGRTDASALGWDHR
jgi:thiamine-monophosphate kinase